MRTYGVSHGKEIKLQVDNSSNFIILANYVGKKRETIGFVKNINVKHESNVQKSGLA